MRWSLPMAIFTGCLLMSCESATTKISDDVPALDGMVDPGVGSDKGADLAVDTVTGATKLILADTHTGWGNPKCWGCHTADDHNDGKDPYLCIGCHGKNGALAAHSDRGSPCSGCHDPAPHGSDGFPDPLSCMSCHVP